MLKLVLSINAVVVEIKLLIDKVDVDDNEFKLLNGVFDVAFKLLIDKLMLMIMSLNY